MPITRCDDYDWESNDTCYNLENLFGTNLENCDDNNCYHYCRMLLTQHYDQKPFEKLCAMQ